MGLFGNQGSTKSSSSSTAVDDSTTNASLSSQYGPVSSFQRGSVGATGGGVAVNGSRNQTYLTTNYSLDGKLAGDTVKTLGDIANNVLQNAAQSNGILATLADHQQSNTLSAVTGRSIGSDASKYVVPLTIGAVALLALLILMKK